MKNTDCCKQEKLAFLKNWEHWRRLVNHCDEKTVMSRLPQRGIVHWNIEWHCASLCSKYFPGCPEWVIRWQSVAKDCQILWPPLQARRARGTMGVFHWGRMGARASTSTPVTEPEAYELRAAAGRRERPRTALTRASSCDRLGFLPMLQHSGQGLPHLTWPHLHQPAAKTRWLVRGWE